MSRSDFLTTGEAAEILKISRSTVSRRFDQGALTGKVNPITAERMISRESILAFIKQHNLPIDAALVARFHVAMAAAEPTFVEAIEAALGSDERLELSRLSSGAETLILCGRKRPDLLILDDAMRDIEAGAVIQSLRRQYTEEELRVLCCCRHADPEACRSWGASRTLTAAEADDSRQVQEAVYDLLGVADEGAEADINFEHKRLYPRFPTSLPARAGIYAVSDPERCAWGRATVRNISRSGAYLAPVDTQGAPFPGEPFRMLLRIDHPLLKDWYAHCQVMRLKSNGVISAGVQFVDMPKECAEQLEDLSRFRAHAAEAH